MQMEKTNIRKHLSLPRSCTVRLLFFHCINSKISHLLSVYKIVIAVLANFSKPSDTAAYQSIKLFKIFTKLDHKLLYGSSTVCSSWRTKFNKSSKLVFAAIPMVLCNLYSGIQIYKNIFCLAKTITCHVPRHLMLLFLVAWLSCLKAIYTSYFCGLLKVIKKNIFPRKRLFNKAQIITYCWHDCFEVLYLQNRHSTFTYSLQ